MHEQDVRFRWFSKRFENDRNWQSVHEDCRDAIWNYLIYGYEPGGFLSGVFSNRLFKAAASADHVNMQRLGYVAKFVMLYLPSACNGSPEQMKVWMALSMQDREKILVEAGLIPDTFKIIKFVAEETA